MHEKIFGYNGNDQIIQLVIINVIMLFTMRRNLVNLHGVGGGGGNGQFVVGQKCQDVDLLLGILARETEVRGDDLDSDVKCCSSTGKMVYLYPSWGALYSQE